MKRISKVLSLVMVVTLMAVLPASTQVMSEARDETADSHVLSMLVLVNRLELSDEQLGSLHEILTGLLEERDGLGQLRDDFEQSMIAFDGTSEELDVLLLAFQEDQRTLTEALRASVEGSMDSLGDLLSVNQGLVLQDSLPHILGAGQGNKFMGIEGRQAMREGMGPGMMRDGQRKDMGLFSREDEADAEGDGVRARLGQGLDNVDIEAMREQMGQRLEQFEAQIPEAMREQMMERIGEALGQWGQRNEAVGERRLPGALGQRSGRLVQGQRGTGTPGQQREPFALLESLVEALELKMSAVE